MVKKRILLFFILIFSFYQIFADNVKSTTPEPYSKEEFPGFMHDLRRAEIITLGAMPFVTFNLTFGYSFANYAIHGFDSSYWVNPFANSSDDNAFSSDEQIAIIVASVCISAGIGLTDFIVHAAKRNNQMRKLKNQKKGPIEITPVAEDPSAVKIDAPARSSNSNLKKDEPEMPQELIEIFSDEEYVLPGKKG